MTSDNGTSTNETVWLPQHILARLWSKRQLIRAMVSRELEGRFKGSLGGLLWYVVNNLMLLAIYSFVFGVVFKVRWQGADVEAGSAGGSFAMPLFIGLIVFNIFAETVNRAPLLVVGNANYVKKVVFPLDILPLVSIGASLFNASIGLLVIIALALLLGTPITWQIVLLPVILLPVLLMTLGFAWFLASIGVFIRDTPQVVSLLVTTLMFFSPIFYPVQMMPERVRWLLHLNPMSLPIEQARGAVLLGKEPDMLPLLGAALLGLGVAWLGWLWFDATRKGFADVI